MLSKNKNFLKPNNIDKTKPKNNNNNKSSKKKSTESPWPECLTLFI